MTHQPKSTIVKEVDRLFRQLNGRRGASCTNPVTGERFIFGMKGEDSIAAQKLNACRALVARDWHANNSPSAPPLLIKDIENARHGGGLSHLLAYFSRSVKAYNWAIAGHPPFETYARGALASPWCPPILRSDSALVEKFPPKPICGLEGGLLYGRRARLA
jgi:hypothetical protein